MDVSLLADLQYLRSSVEWRKGKVARRCRDVKHAERRQRFVIFNLFISYRRSDEQWASVALKKAIESASPSSKVFLDVASIQPGRLWRDDIINAINQSNIMLAVIGKSWGARFGNANKKMLMMIARILSASRLQKRLNSESLFSQYWFPERLCRIRPRYQAI